jgi:hypothetical protein
VTGPSGWQTVNLPRGWRVKSPVPLQSGPAAGIDSPAGVWEAPDLRLTFDAGPYADPLTAYAERADADVRDESIAGSPGRLATVMLEDGARLAAAHVPANGGPESEPVTVSVVGRGSLGGDIPLQVVRTLERADPNGSSN